MFKDGFIWNEDLVNIILEYSDDHESFDREFIDSISDAFQEYGELTCGQSAACQNIVDSYRMIKWKRDKMLNESSVDDNFCVKDNIWT